MPEMDEAPLGERDLLLELLLDRLGAVEDAATPAEQAGLAAQIAVLKRQLAALPGAGSPGPARPA